MAHGDLYIELKSGSSERTSVCFHPGLGLEPLSLGRNAFWRIAADGISDVHAFIYFDGETVFIASGDPGNPAVAAGALVGSDWTELLAPCEIRLGHAVLTLRAAPRPAPFDPGFERPADLDFDDGEFSTARVDGRHLEAEHRRRKPDIGFVRDDDEPTRMAEPAQPPQPAQPAGPIAQRKSRRKPRIKVPSVEEATRFNPIDEQLASHKPREGDAPTVPELPAVHGAEAATIPDIVALPEAPARQGAGMPPSQHPGMPPSQHPGMPPSQHPAMRPSQQPAMPPQYPGMQPAGFVPPGVAGAQPISAAPQPIGFPGVPTQPGPFPAPGYAAPAPVVVHAPVPFYDPATTTSPSRLAVTPSRHVARAREMWRQASLPQKAILCLLPVAFAAVLVMFGDDENEAAASKPRSQKSPVASASAAPSASGPASTAAPVEATSTPTPAESAVATSRPASDKVPHATDKGPQATSGKGAPPRTLERQASDAIAAGSHAEAIKLYEQLAAQNPEAAVYKEALRILRAKAAEHK